MRRIVSPLVALISLISLSSVSNTFAQDEDRGLSTGSKAPPFTLKDAAGNDQSLEGLLKKGNVALVFHRSADW